MPRARSFSTAATISAVVSPNLERSPVHSTHLPAPFVREARPHADHRPQVEIAGGGEDRVELAQAVHGDDDPAAELLGEERRLDERAVLVAVAEDEGLGVLLEGEGHQQLRLRARLDPEVEGPAVLHQLLDDVALLVDLDRVDAAVGCPCSRSPRSPAGRRRRAARRGVRRMSEKRMRSGRLSPRLRRSSTSSLRSIFMGAGPGRGDLDVARFVDVEEVAAPTVDVVQLDGVLDRPGPELGLQLTLPPPGALARGAPPSRQC